MRVVEAPTRVLLVDDQPLLTDSLARLLAAEPDIDVVGVANSVAEAKRLARREVDVVLMDYRLPDGTGADATRAIKSRWPAARVVMLSAIQDDDTMLDAIQAGADGYLTKDRAVDEVVSAVRDARAGATLIPEAIVATIASRVINRTGMPERPPFEALTQRELDVLRALAAGMTTDQVCAELAIARNTFRTHVQNITVKLKVHSKLEAVTLAIRHRIIEPPGSSDRLY